VHNRCGALSHAKSTIVGQRRDELLRGHPAAYTAGTPTRSPRLILLPSTSSSPLVPASVCSLSSVLITANGRTALCPDSKTCPGGPPRLIAARKPLARALASRLASRLTSREWSAVPQHRGLLRRFVGPSFVEREKTEALFRCSKVLLKMFSPRLLSTVVRHVDTLTPAKPLVY